jgi:8-oxo-dGTP pyrophosphatase MutT (NUDIX family)
MDLTLLKGLPSPFYRVAVKCLVFNDANEVLVVKNSDGEIEIPGGGWEHGESIEECVRREVLEELGVGVSSISEVKTVLQGKSERGWGVLRVVVVVEPGSMDFAFNDPEVVSAFYVNQQDLADLNFCPSDAPFADAADLIWGNR